MPADDTARLLAQIAALASQGGGTLPLSGSYQLSAPLIIPANVVVRGPATLNWAQDLGTGVAAVRTDPAALQGAAPKFEYVNLVGPGTRNPDTPVGTQLANMDGFAPGSCVDFLECTAIYFRAGWRIQHDHNALTRCRSNSNFYNVLFDDTNFDYGNQLFIGCYFDGPLFASVAVSGANLIDQSNFLQCHLGFGPYAFYKFDGPQGPSTKGFLAGVRIDGCAFEACGNGAILDESTGAPGGQDSLFGTDIVNPGFLWDDQGIYRIPPPRSRDYAVKVRRVERSRMWGGSSPFLAGDVGTVRADYGDLDWDLGRFYNDYSTLFGTDTTNGAIGSVAVRDGVNWQAMLCTNGSGRAIQRGEPMEMGLGWFQANALGTQGNPFFGVALHDAQANAPILVGIRGTVYGLCAPIGFTGTPLAAQAGNPGQFVPTTVVEDRVASSVGNNGGTGPALVSVILR
jgi:hypothetical protein